MTLENSDDRGWRTLISDPPIYPHADKKSKGTPLLYINDYISLSQHNDLWFIYVTTPLHTAEAEISKNKAFQLMAEVLEADDIEWRYNHPKYVKENKSTSNDDFEGTNPLYEPFEVYPIPRGFRDKLEFSNATREDAEQERDKAIVKWIMSSANRHQQLAKRLRSYLTENINGEEPDDLVE